MTKLKFFEVLWIFCNFRQLYVKFLSPTCLTRFHDKQKIAHLFRRFSPLIYTFNAPVAQCPRAASFLDKNKLGLSKIFRAGREVSHARWHFGT